MMKKFGITLADVSKKSKEQSKKKNYMGWHQAFGGGEAPINNSIFNMGTGPTVSADGGIGMVSSVGEDLEMDYEELAKREDLDEKDVFIKKQFDNSFMPKHKKDCVKKPQTKEDEYDDDFTLKGMFEDLDSDDPEVKVTEYECKKPRFYEDVSEDEDGGYDLIRIKTIIDSDGFNTEYALYHDNQSGQYFTMFGDMDLYEPNIEYADAVFDSYREAKEWFDSYNGFEDEDDYNFDVDECVHKEMVLPSHVKKETNPKKDSYDDLEDIDFAYTDKDFVKECKDFEYDDTPLNETAISDLAYDVQFEQGYVDKLKKNISDLEKELDFLKNTAPKEIRRGGAFDSQEEIDDAVKATERELDLQRAKYNIIKRSQK